MIIRIVLIAVILYMLVVFLNQRSTTRGQAWSKLIVLLLLLSGIIAVILPGLTNDIAHTVGVGRGADLLLYFLTVAFIGSLLGQYLHNQDENLKFVRLARRIAIMDANENQHNRKNLTRNT
jgi:hypothetical protein